MNEGKAYQFRVKAVNSEGESEPLETELPTVAKNPYGKIKSNILFSLQRVCKLHCGIQAAHKLTVSQILLQFHRYNVVTPIKSVLQAAFI